MRNAKRLLALLLTMCLLLPLASCGKEETPTATAGGEEVVTMTDAEALAKFIADFKAGVYDDQRLFNYEDLTQFITLPDYKSFTYPDHPDIATKVTDEQVEIFYMMIVLDMIVKEEGHTTLTEGEICRWDVVTMDYRAEWLDGTPVFGIDFKDQSLRIGSGEFMEGFESGLLGKKIGEEIRLDLHYPVYYDRMALADKDVVFYVTVKSVKRPTIPEEVTVEQLNAVSSVKYESVEKVKEHLKEVMDTNAVTVSYTNIANYLYRKLSQESQMKAYPEKETQYLYDKQMEILLASAGGSDNYESYCQETYSMSYEALCDMTLEESRAEVRSQLALLQVARELNVQVSDEQLSAYIIGYYETENEYFADLYSFIQGNVQLNGPDVFYQRVLNSLAMNELVALAKLQ